MSDPRDDLQAQLDQARAERDTALRLHDDFVSALSHDLRTPLNAILNWSELLQQSTPGVDLAQGLAAIDRSARLQAQMLTDLVDLSRLQTGALQLDIETFEPAPMLAAALSASRHAADARELQLHSHLATGVETITGDPQRLQRVLEHLLANAIRHTPRKGAVHLELRQLDDGVLLEVIDKGYGFGPGLLDALQGTVVPPGKPGVKLGMGLRLARRVADLHGGSLQASSAGKNQGACFGLKLPRTPA